MRTPGIFAVLFVILLPAVALPEEITVPHADVATPEMGGTGTAWVVHPDGYLVTNVHVVAGANRGESVEVDGRLNITVNGKSYLGRVVGLSKDRDLALLKVNATDLPALPLADSDAVQLGQEIRVLGYPISYALGQTVKVTRGTISGIEQQQAEKRFQTDAVTNPGNSGGPVIDDQGQVIAVHYAGLNPRVVKDPLRVTKLGFSVPVNYVKELLAKHGVSPKATIASGKVDGVALVKRTAPAVAFVRSEIFTLVLSGHGERIDSVSFSPEGGYLASASEHRVLLWESATGNRVNKLEIPKKCSGARFAPQGLVLGVSDYSNGLRYMPLLEKDAKAARLFRHYVINEFAFSPKGDRLATVGNHLVTIWDVASGKRLHEISETVDEFSEQLAFSQDGETLATAYSDQTRFLNVRTGKVKKVIADAKGPIAFAPNAQVFYSNRQIWNTTTLAPIREVATDSMWAPDHAVFMPNGRLLMFAQSGDLYLTDVRTGQQVARITRTPSPQEQDEGGRFVGCLAVSPSGLIAATGHSNGRVVLWDLAGHLRKLPTLLADRIESPGHGDVAWSPDGRVVLHVQRHPDMFKEPAPPTARVSRVRIWKRSGRLMHTFDEPGAVSAAAISSDNSQVALAGGLIDAAGKRGAGFVVIRRLDTGEIVRRLGNFKELVNSVDFSPDGEHVLAEDSAAKQVSLWDLATGKKVKAYAFEGERISNVEFSPDGTKVGGLASPDPYGRVQLPFVWDAATGARVDVPVKENSCLRVFAFSQDGRLFAALNVGESGFVRRGGDDTITVWDLDSGKQIRKIPAWPANDVGDARDLHFSADSSTLRVVCAEKVVDFALHNGDPIKEVAHAFTLTVRISPDGRQLLYLPHVDEDKPSSVQVRWIKE